MLLYRLVPAQLKKWLLIISGCIFYGSWNWKFLFLLFLTSGTDYFAARKISTIDNLSARKPWLVLSVTLNIAVLGIFKYYNFFSEAFVDLLHLFGVAASKSTLQLVLPVGISFYTFQSIAYVTDVYRKKIDAFSDNLFTNAPAPTPVIDTISKLVEIKNPKFNYPVGKGASVILAIQHFAYKAFENSITGNINKFKK